MVRLFNLAGLLAALGLAGCVNADRMATAPGKPARSPLILVSIDGMRPDYLTRGVTPNLAGLAARGVRGAAMRPSFPSVTFPNHYTLVTGLRPDRHGVVGNTMEDPAIPGVRFTLGNQAAVTDRRWWDGAEPIWVTAEKAGMQTATMFWPGSEAAIGGVRPTRFAVFDGAMPNDTRVDTLLGWLDAGLTPGLMTLYFDEVDHEGHGFGPDAPETTAAAGRVDAAIGRLLAGLEARGLDANVIVVADHGMAATPRGQIVRVDELLPPGSFNVVTAGAVLGLAPAPGQEAAVAAALVRRHPHMECWRKADIPARLAFGRHPRVPAFVCVAAVGWVILAGPPREGGGSAGTHGYDPAAPEMAAMFVAAGPGFRQDVVLPAFDNVDVHPLMLRLIGLPPRASDGTMAVVGKGLK